ncbi:MAG: molecular chaperone DnaJ [Aestuariivita sp.]|nr:molecular chaperone DnaJ [Aestuariivita sp.]MCY4346048.1 molecular chaperone DnaJ [Aestuariivita sp.]
MNKPDLFGFDMSVSSAKKKNPRRRGGITGASDTSTRICDHQGCTKAGLFRAPKAPDDSLQFYWFCQEHVQEYNKKWNFFDSVADEEEQTQESRSDFGNGFQRRSFDPETRAWARLGIEDPHQVLGANATRNLGRSGASRKLSAVERRALEILDAEGCTTKAEVRKVYNALIKVLHPDSNGGDRSQEEQLQQVVWAWDQIKSSSSFSD